MDLDVYQLIYPITFFLSCKDFGGRMNFSCCLGCVGYDVSLSTIFQLYRGGQFYWWRKPEDLEKTMNLSQVTDKLYHLMLYASPWLRCELT
jgi:hypothetical protein